jgi:hypothetical protein
LFKAYEKVIILFDKNLSDEFDELGNRFKSNAYILFGRTLYDEYLKTGSNKK